MTPVPPAPEIEKAVVTALEEDIGSGDITSRYFVDAGCSAEARIVSRERCVVAGVEVAAATFLTLDPDLHVEILLESGAKAEPGTEVLAVAGLSRSILAAERVALNFLQRLSGVATLTRQYVDAVAGTGARILDTRKTTPGLRVLEKAAVRAGGGQNHRFGLFDMAMVKDNHLAAGGGTDALVQGIARIKAEHPDIRVQMEADTLEQVRTFLGIPGVDGILLDNMESAELCLAVALAAGRIPLEASGGITLETAAAIAATGVDFLSVGALTHSAAAIDYGLDFR